MGVDNLKVFCVKYNLLLVFLHKLNPGNYMAGGMDHMEQFFQNDGIVSIHFCEEVFVE